MPAGAKPAGIRARILADAEPMQSSDGASPVALQADLTSNPVPWCVAVEPMSAKSAARFIRVTLNVNDTTVLDIGRP